MTGICIYNLVPVRAEASDKSEMVTQLLFGDVYAIKAESENGKWIQIVISEDNYIGWIDKKLHSNRNSGNELNIGSNHFCSESVGMIRNGEECFPVFFGSYLPSFDGTYVYINNHKFLYSGSSDKTEKKLTGDNIISNAGKFLGTPYLWGGKSHAGIDCSGLVQIVFRSCGFIMKRDAWQQASMGLPVDSLEKAKSGDLAFFSNDAGRITHVGILMGNDKIIHAHGKVRIDSIDDKGIINGDSGLYSHKLNGIRTIT